jgi:PAN domain
VADVLVRHNTKFLEEAIDLQVKRAAIPTLAAEAAAHDKIVRANAFRRMMTGGAVAVAAVGIGLGAALFWERQHRPISADFPPANPPVVVHEDSGKVSDRLQPSETIDEEGKTTRPKSRDVELPQDNKAQTPPEDPQSPDIPTVDFNKFLTREIDWGGAHWTLVSGHHFSDEKDPTWDRAWCYTRRLVNGVDVNVDLVNRPSPTARPQAPAAPGTTLTSIGLNDETALDLASKCAWLDGSNFASTDYDAPSGRVPAPKDELVVQEGWDALGSDLPGMPIRNVTIDVCRSDCQANSSCMAFTYNNKFRACFLKGNAAVLIRSPDATTAAKATISGNLKYSDLALAAHKALIGDMLTTGRMSYSECVLACATNDQCAGFNSNSNTFCTLFSRVTLETTNNDFASGRKGGVY